MKYDQSRFGDDSLISRRVCHTWISVHAHIGGCCRLILVIALFFCDGVFVLAQNTGGGELTKQSASGNEQSQSDLPVKLQEIHSQALKNRESKDFAQADQLRLKRLDLLRKSTAKSPWTAGCKAIDEADSLIKQMKYKKACERLKEAWDAFDSMPAGETVFGDIAMKLFEAVQAAKAVYPDATAETNISSETLRKCVRRAADDDPCQVEALAVDAFLTEPNPDESFQPAELRPSLRLRNKRLIDISYSKDRDKHPMPWHAPAEFLKAKSSSFVLDDVNYYRRFLDPSTRLQGFDRSNEPFSLVMGGAMLVNAPSIEGTTSLCVAEYVPGRRSWLRMRPMILTVGPVAGKAGDWSIDKSRLSTEIPVMLREIDEERRRLVKAEVLATADGLLKSTLVKQGIEQHFETNRGDLPKALLEIIAGYTRYGEAFREDAESAAISITAVQIVALNWARYAGFKQACDAQFPQASQPPFTLASADALQRLSYFLAKDNIGLARPEDAATKAATDGSAATDGEKRAPKANVRARPKTPAKKSGKPDPKPSDEEQGGDEATDSGEQGENPFVSEPSAAATPVPSYVVLRSRLASRVPDYGLMSCYQELNEKQVNFEKFIDQSTQRDAASAPGGADRMQWWGQLKQGHEEYKRVVDKASKAGLTLDPLITTRDALIDMSDSMARLGIVNEFSLLISAFLQRADEIVLSARVEQDILLKQGAAKRVHSWTIGRNVWTVYEIPKGATNATVANWIDYSRITSFDIDVVERAAKTARVSTVPESTIVPVRSDVTSEDNPLVVSNNGRRVLQFSGELNQTIVTLLLAEDHDTEKDFMPVAVGDEAGQGHLWLHDSVGRYKATLVTKATAPAELVINYPGVDGHVPLGIPQTRFGTVRYLIDRRSNRIVKGESPPEDSSSFYAMTSSAGNALTDPSVNYRIKDLLDLDRNIMNSFLPDLMLHSPSPPSWQLYRREFMRRRPAADWFPAFPWSSPRRAFR